ncbi:MAG: ATP-binding protein [Oscillospiraceae bacterium]|nr:ATP-binding protein [Oscillospiraceae bacterium]
MTELSLYVLDIVQNSVTAGASRIDVGLEESGGDLTFTVRDDGRGMSRELLGRALDPFTTTRTTRKVGLGLPFLKQLAEQTGGSLALESEPGAGTTLTAVFGARHIDMPPMGDWAGTVTTLVQGSPDIRFTFRRSGGGGDYSLDTDELREALGGDVPLNHPDVLMWLNEFITENERNL